MRIGLDLECHVPRRGQGGRHIERSRLRSGLRAKVADAVQIIAQLSADFPD
jgi:hypothetical protein